MLTHSSPASPVEVPPALPSDALPRANWADAFEIEIDNDSRDMRVLAERTVGAMPPWARRLLKLRNVLGAPFGLKPDGLRETKARHGFVDIFPVLEVSEHQIVLGLDDWHLDFRIVMDRIVSEHTCRLRVTTLVNRHNAFGRAYIALVTPFHRAIVQSVLKKAA